MPLTAYCKKCKAEVPWSPQCPVCGGKLPQSAARLRWQMPHTPLRDWMCWNSVMRVAVPVLAAVLVLALVLETIAGGLRGAERLLLGGFVAALAGIWLVLCVLTLLLLILQGEDALECEAGGKGLTVRTWLPEPGRLDLLSRFRSPALMQKADPATGWVLVGEKQIAWKEIRRIQLWPEKAMVLAYAPRWWMRVALPCDPYLYPEVLGLIQEKCGKRKDVILPPELPLMAVSPAAAQPGEVQMEIPVEQTVEPEPTADLIEEEESDVSASAPEAL